MKNKNLVLPILIALLCYACGSQVKTVNPDEKNLDNYKSYAFLPNANLNASSEQQDVSKVVVETVNANMERAGYTLDSENPDLLVLISSKNPVEPTAQQNPSLQQDYAAYPYTDGVGTVSPAYGNYYYGGFGNFGRITGYDTDSYEYEAGAVIIDLVDRKTKETVWKGKTSKNLVDQADLEAQEEMVNLVFSEFPAFQKDSE
ncbi:DUF4136 domain-containing protein [Zunongwangia endophytica]|uniref:DUF4136 domain-containing protein n=1 Tax=Zunongwangia endophytica TaxID=1808945 RepID=A0ABV8H9W6_9FLAO|nr:DUF4136 domain-containing protein [Zunongwangia endophytica]MDN3593839.1 DUF4136 domain-containing protein [Zunongwangia endophytica]